MQVRTAVMRYLGGATLARGADAGAAVGFVLLKPTVVGAVLAACLTAPHLLGPVLARRLDRARDGRRLIAVVCAAYGVFLAIAALGLDRIPLVLVVLAAATAGVCGPLLTGGLSSRLAALVPGDERAQRRAQGLDALSYGIGGTAGPAAAAALASLTGARVSLLVLATAAVIAGLLVLSLPAAGNPVPRDEVLSVRQALTLILTTGPLRRVMYTTVVASVPGGAIAVIAVAYAPALRVSPGTAGLLAAAYGFGVLLGSLAVTARPLLGEPERLVTRAGALMGVAYGLCAAAPGFALAFAGFTLIGVLNAPFFTATLASRAAYSPPQARAQVFVSMAALKVGGQSAGTAAAGTALGLGARTLLLIGAALIIATAAATVLDRRRWP
ncbi:MFS transporter [Actinoplanes sp. NPDC089786]|uniref:MFS transporter n=1 Tax=Actinoplanes sp. NPDC089786 TaxID=3155185 RepID=UPI00341A4885